MYALRSLTHQEQYSQLQKVVSFFAAAVLCVGAVYPVRALGQGQPKPPVFKPAVTFCSGGSDNGNCLQSNPSGLVVADLIGDDDYPDVAVVNVHTQPVATVAVFQNSGVWNDPAEGLILTGLYPISGFPYDIAAADLGADHQHPTPDGNLDLVVTSRSGWLWIGYSNGSGQFYWELVYLDLEYPYAMGLTLWDFDQNGTVDIAVACREVLGPWEYESRVELLWRELESGDWTHQVIVPPEPAGAQGTQIVAGHVRQPSIPGRLDLVMTNMPEDKIFVLLNDGNRQFNTNPPPGFDPVQDASASHGLALGKFRPGPKTPIDLALSATLASKADVYFAGTDAVFRLDDDYELAGGTCPLGVDVGRINPDTKNDFVVALAAGEPCQPGGGIAVFVGYGDGTFVEPPSLFCVHPGNDPRPQFVKIGDMDQDGFNDIVTSNNNSHTISVLINAFEAIPPGGP